MTFALDILNRLWRVLISIGVWLIRICAANREGELWLRKNLQDKKHSENSSSKFSTLHFMLSWRFPKMYVWYDNLHGLYRNIWPKRKIWRLARFFRMKVGKIFRGISKLIIKKNVIDEIMERLQSNKAEVMILN